MKDRVMTDDTPDVDAQARGLSVLAITSTVVAVGGFFVPLTGLRILAGIVAVILGFAALGEIKIGIKSGKSWATAGIGLGCLVAALAVFVIVADNFS